MNRVDRNKILIRYLVTNGYAASQKDLGYKLGYKTESAFSQVINEKVEYPKDFILRLTKILPELNIEWLVNGTGSILTSETPMDDIPVVEVEDEASETFPILPEDVAIKPNTDIREYINDNIGELEHINPSQMLSHADMAERILRTSMMPTFQPDDIVFVRFLQDKMKIVDGDIYYIDSKNRPTMIRQVKFTEEGKLRLIAQNPQYGDIIMCRDEINNIAIIVGLLRMNFSDQYSELENLRRKNDQAMERRNDQMDKILEQQSKLIDFITKTK